MARSVGVAALLLCAVALAPRGASAAGEDDPVRAQVLFEQAVELARGGDYAGACGKLEQSLSLHDGLGTAFHLAGCWQKLGRTASSYALFSKVAGKAHDLGQAEREDVAHARAEALLPKLARVRIELTKPPAHTEVRRDGEVVPESEWGKPVPVDPGTHEICVSAEGKTPWSSKLDVSEPATTLVVQVPALEDLPKEEPVKAALPVLVPQRVPPRPAAPEPTPDPAAGSGRRTLAIIVGGVGVAALGAGLFEGTQYLHENRTAKGLCPSGVDCTSDEISQHDQAVEDARKARTWAYVGVGVGTLAAAAGAYLYLSAPSASGRGRAKAIRVLPVADGSGTWGGSVVGSF